LESTGPLALFVCFVVEKGAGNANAFTANSASP
jgi:hypothetical protein